MIYLASPYTHPKKKVMTKRYLQVKELAVSLMCDGWKVFSPVIYGHAMKDDLPKEFNWYVFDLHILFACEALAVFCLPGWSQSPGVKDEIAHALARGMPVRYFAFEDGVITGPFNDGIFKDEGDE